MKFASQSKLDEIAKEAEEQRREITDLKFRLEDEAARRQLLEREAEDLRRVVKDMQAGLIDMQAGLLGPQ